MSSKEQVSAHHTNLNVNADKINHSVLIIETRDHIEKHSNKLNQ